MGDWSQKFLACGGGESTIRSHRSERVCGEQQVVLKGEEGTAGNQPEREANKALDEVLGWEQGWTE